MISDHSPGRRRAGVEADPFVLEGVGWLAAGDRPCPASRSRLIPSFRRIWGFSRIREGPRLADIAATRVEALRVYNLNPLAPAP